MFFLKSLKGILKRLEIMINNKQHKKRTGKFEKEQTRMLEKKSIVIVISKHWLDRVLCRVEEKPCKLEKNPRKYIKHRTEIQVTWNIWKTVLGMRDKRFWCILIGVSEENSRINRDAILQWKNGWEFSRIKKRHDYSD